MNITDELRHFADEWDWLDYKADESARRLRAIADRIDAAHEESVQQALMGEGSVPATDENMAEYGWVRLPKDANGEPIHIGDVMESKGSDFLFDEASFEVRSMRCNECGWEVYDRLGDRYAPSLLRHHHEPTVEDVLRQVIACANNGTHVHGALDTEQIVAEYAAKLRLAEGEDA